MIQVFLFTILISFSALAQDVVDAPPGLQTTLEELDQQNQQLIQQTIEEFKKDPNVEVTQTETETVIKKRTKQSKNLEDPKALENMANLQRMFNFGFGAGFSTSSKKSFEPYASTIPNQNYNLHTTAMAIGFEGGVRPPAPILKRFLLGVGVQVRTADFPEEANVKNISHDQRTHQLVHMSFDHIEKWWSAEWDVLVLPGKRTANAFSAGYFSGQSYIYDTDTSTPVAAIETPVREKGVQLRWRGIVANLDESMGLGWHVVTRISTNGVVTTYFGLNVMFGPRMWIKKRVRK